MAGDQNTVKIEVSAQDDTGAGFASAEGRSKAFQRLMDETTRKEIAGHQAMANAESQHLRSLKLLQDVEAELGRTADDTANRQSRLGRIFSGVNGSLASGLSSLGESFGSAASAGSSLAIVLPMVAAAAAAITIALTPAVAALGLIAAGYAAFGIAAVGEIQKVITAHQKLAAAQVAYDKATTKAGRASALRAEQQATEGLTGSEKALMKMMDGLAAQFRKLEQAVRPTVLLSMYEAMRIIKTLMPTLTLLAKAAGQAFATLLQHIADWLTSKSGQKFIEWMATTGPQAIIKFTDALWTIAQTIGKVAAWMYKNGEVMDQRFRSRLHSIANATDATRETLIKFGHGVEAVANSVGHAVGNVAHFFAAAFRTIVSVVSGAYHAVVGFVNSIVSALSQIPAAVSGALGSISGLGGGVGSVIGGIGRILHMASGGIAGAAAGGVHGGLRVVGEHGRELLELPPGTRVHSNPDTERMLAGAHGGGVLTLQIESHGDELTRAIVRALRLDIRTKGHGDVQAYLGRP